MESYFVIETSHFLIPWSFRELISKTVCQKEKKKLSLFFSEYHQYLERYAETKRSPIFPEH